MHCSIGGTGQGLGEGAAWGWGGKEKGILARSGKTKLPADSGVGTWKEEERGPEPYTKRLLRLRPSMGHRLHVEAPFSFFWKVP